MHARDDVVSNASAKAAVINWLVICALLVAAMVVVGGLTRLTESGLSIVEWKPVSGIVPPVSDMAWQLEFEAYQQSPQYRKINEGMTLGEFKGIYWLEYIHRLLGRITGFVFLVPFLWFLSRRELAPAVALQLAGIFALGGLQGVVGWYMVKSGLVDQPWVSPLRLAFHMGLAFVIFGWLFLLIQKIRAAAQNYSNLRLPEYVRALCVMSVAVVFLQSLLGALVAGNDAGLTYNTFPLMDGRFVPEGLWLQQPAFINFIENITMVQFNHRIMAYVTFMVVLLCCIAGFRHAANGRLKTYLMLTLFCLLAQVVLGIATLILVVPVSLASLHQANALALFALCLKLCHIAYAAEKLREAKHEPAAPSPFREMAGERVRQKESLRVAHPNPSLKGEGYGAR